MEIELDKFSVLQTQYPTYMQDIFRKSDDITLIHLKTNPNLEESIVDISIPNIIEEPTKDPDLIGNPLKVDLRNDEDLNLGEAVVTPDNWTAIENKHYPIEKSIGRKFLNMNNQFHSYKIYGEDKEENAKVLPVFVLLDPKDDTRGTYLLGSNVSTNTRLISYIKGCFSCDDPEMDPVNMIEKHRKKHRSANNITSTVITIYSVKGYNMRNNQQNSSYSSIHLEVMWNGCSKSPNLNSITSSKIKMQIMNGHSDSPFSNLWEELQFIRFLLSAYNKDDFDDLEFTFNPMHISLICDKIKDIMQPGKLTRTKEMDLNKLDLKNREDADFLDKLWGVLLSVENLSDLIECFIILFEGFAAQNSFILNKIDDNNATSIGIIIKGICEGTMAVPNVTSSQALLYLIELGVQKLKNDYIYISNHCHEVMSIMNYWSEISTPILEMNKQNGQGMGTSRMTVVPRRTRITMAKSQDTHILNNIMKQVNYLANLHVMEQFVYLVHTGLPLEMRESLVESIIKQYSSGGSLTLEKLHENSFQEVVLDLHSSLYLSYLETLNIVSWNLNNNSKYKNSEVTSIFHYSDKPIIPTCIFKDYNILSENKKYYLTETYVLTN